MADKTCRNFPILSFSDLHQKVAAGGKVCGGERDQAKDKVEPFRSAVECQQGIMANLTTECGDFTGRTVG